MRYLDSKAADMSWKYDSGFGNHRIMVGAEQAKYVRVHLPWRRRDCNPECIGVRICYTPEGKVKETGVGTDEVLNIKIENPGREEGCLVFEAPVSGVYEIYYLPYTMDGWPYSPDTVYLHPDEMTPDKDWLDAMDEAQITEGKVLHYECRTDFDNFYPMGIPMTAEETAAFSPADVPFFTVTESRLRPIQMKHQFPYIWVHRSAEDRLVLTDTAHRNEHYVFQIAVCAACDLENVQIRFYDGDGRALTDEKCVCFNFLGRDADGVWFAIHRNAAAGEILPLWCGIPFEDWEIPANGIVELTAEITAANTDHTERVRIVLHVENTTLPGNGDNELWRMSRLFWLNSDIAVSDDVIEPYLPIEHDDRECSLKLLGRKVWTDALGLPSRICSYFNDEGGIGEKAHEILREGIRLHIEKEGAVRTADKAPVPEKEIKGTGTTVLRSSAARNDVAIESHIKYEADGHIDCKIHLTALDEGDYSFALQVPVASEIASTMMGMCYTAGRVPAWWEYKWTTDRVGNMLWLGCVHAGIQVKLMQEDEFWGHWGDHDSILPEFWHNGGRGKMTVRSLPADSTVLFEGLSGRMHLCAGESRLMHFHILITPFHPIDYRYHWTQHIAGGTTDLYRDEGRTIGLNFHASQENPYINYPFVFPDRMKAFVDKYHEDGLRVQIYYTVRELSTYCREIWALRALGDEIYNPDVNSVVISDFFVPENEKISRTGMAFSPNRWRGGAWLIEHLTDGYVGAWHQPLFNGDCDCSVGMQGVSRWHNYYLRGLKWLLDEVGIDSIYLDDIGYDRRIMKRLRRILKASGKQGDVTIHSGDGRMNFYGYVSPINKYMEHFAYADSLWIGEGYKYSEIPYDFYMTEISGIPFGLMNDMLQDGGNPWRGLIYGMTCRLDQKPVVGRILTTLRNFGIEDSRMLGYWHPECPVTAENDQVRATTYIREDGSVMVALATWYPGNGSYLVFVNKEQLGIEGDYEFYAPAIEDFQNEAVFPSGKPIPFEQGKGWLFMLRKK